MAEVEVFYCGAITRRARLHEDPEPEERCENEVDHEGDLCSVHEEDDRSDELYESYLEARYEARMERDWDPADYADDNDF